MTVTIPKKFGAKNTQQVSWPLQGTLWACADQQHRSKAFGKADSEIIKAHSMQVSEVDTFVVDFGGDWGHFVVKHRKLFH